MLGDVLDHGEFGLLLFEVCVKEWLYGSASM